MKNWRYWGDLGYWRWLWQRAGSDVKALGAVVLAVAFGGLGFLVAGGVAGDASAKAGSEPGGASRTTIVRTLTTTTRGGQVVVRRVQVAPGRTFLSTATEQLLRTITTPGGTRVVTDAVTKTVPVLRRVVVTGPGGTQTRVETVARTVTNGSTATQTQTRTDTVTRTDVRTDTVTRTDVRTDTVTRTETVESPPETHTVTATVTEPPVTQTVTTTVTEPAVTVTISLPDLP